MSYLKHFACIFGISIFLHSSNAELDPDIVKYIYEDLKNFAFSSTEQKSAPQEVCYQDIGCFSTQGTFKHLNKLPSSPESIKTSFGLFTRSNLNYAVYLDYLDNSTLGVSEFNPQLPVKIICHGFTQSGMTKMFRLMKNAILQREEANVIIVGWGWGALPPMYSRAAVNTEVVGRQMGRLIQLLKEHRNIATKDVHLIGFSLGAHVVGFAGKWLKQISGDVLGRITALDPAGPYFEGKGENVHVSREDAMYVDVIHSSSEGSLLNGALGMKQAVGHADFYPNGGKDQPGCTVIPPCKHERAVYFYTDTITSNCEFKSYACPVDFSDFQKGLCLIQKGIMGYNSSKENSEGSLYLLTKDKAPFCGVSANIIVHSSENQESSYGTITVYITGENGISDSTVIIQSRYKMKPAETTNVVVVLKPDVFPIREVSVQYTKDDGWFYKGRDSWTLDSVTVIDGVNNIRFNSDGQDIELKSGQKIALSKNFGQKCEYLDIIE